MCCAVCVCACKGPGCVRGAQGCVRGARGVCCLLHTRTLQSTCVCMLPGPACVPTFACACAWACRPRAWQPVYARAHTCLCACSHTRNSARSVLAKHARMRACRTRMCAPPGGTRCTPRASVLSSTSPRTLASTQPVVGPAAAPPVLVKVRVVLQVADPPEDGQRVVRLVEFLVEGGAERCDFAHGGSVAVCKSTPRFGLAQAPRPL